MIARAVLPALFAASALAAETVQPCDDFRSNAQAIAEPWEDNSRVFANGDVRLAVIDTIEPAAAAFHLLVISPPRDELGGRQCRVISLDGASGFASLSLTGLTASYDATAGLGFQIPAKRYLPDSGDFGPATLHVTVNQASGAISARLQ
jgi:hypothetical protein